MSEPMVPETGTVWVESDTEYMVQYLDEDGDWTEEYSEAESANRAMRQVKELLESDVEPDKIRIIEELTIRRVVLVGEVEARAKRERGEG